MKTLLLLMVLLLVSCGKSVYNVDIIYQNGEVECIQIETGRGNEPYLSEGCLHVQGYNTVRCGVREIDYHLLKNK